MQLGQAGYELHYMNCCSGSCGTVTEDRDRIVEIRTAEARAAAASIGATFHPALVDDLELCYDAPTLHRLASVVRDVKPDIVLTHSYTDYMEDHQNAGRLAVTATFARGMRNFPTEPHRAAIEARVDLLSHPGLITPDDAARAAELDVHLEITTHKGHGMSNGWVAQRAREAGAKLLLNTDCHISTEILDAKQRRAIAFGAGLTTEEVDQIWENGRRIVDRIVNR